MLTAWPSGRGRQLPVDTPVRRDFEPTQGSCRFIEHETTIHTRYVEFGYIKFRLFRITFQVPIPFIFHTG